MKKLICIFCILISLTFSLFCGCGDKQVDTPNRGNVSIDVKSIAFTASGNVLALTSKTSLKDYLDELQKKGEITFEGKEGSYGLFIEKIFDTKAEGNFYWALYTDLVKIEGDDAVYSNSEYGTFEYKGKTLNMANYGVSSLPCVEGYTYAFVLTGF